MAVNKLFGTRINQVLIFFSGLIIIVSAVLVYYSILRGIYGRFDTSEILPDSNIIEDFLFGKEPEVAILYSKYTENMLPIGSTWLNDNISTWKKFLGDQKLKFEIISDQDIEAGKHYQYKLIVLPGTKSISDKEAMQLKKYLEKGGSVFATGGIGSYSNDGKWRGWEYLNQVFGLQFSHEIKPDEYSKIHTVCGSLPITANIPTGFPLKVATWDRPMAVEVLDPRTTQVSFWYNYRMDDGLVREEIKKSAGIAYGNFSRGRFMWMGFELNSIIGVQEDYIFFERLFSNSIKWLLYSPIAYVRDWPTGFEAAAVISPVISENTENINNLLPIIKDEGVSATFFVNPELAEKNREVIKNISTYGEIAALVDIGYLASVNDKYNKLNSYSEQLNKLISAKEKLEKISGSSVSGFLPYYGLFDNNTLNSVIKANYKYVFTDSLTDRSVPKTIIRGDKRIVSMTKTARDDFEIIRDFGLSLPEFQFYTYQEDLDRVLFEGGMYVFKLHNDYQCRSDYVDVVKDVIKDLKKKKFWITTATEIQKWYEKRDYIEIKTDRRGKTRVAIKVSNPGVETINNLVIDLDLNDFAKNIAIGSELIGTKSASVKHNPGSQMVYLFVDDLTPGESRQYYVDYDRVEF
ncbi:MAG: polysaccharide deacetylase family protein [Ignavibacteriales bacterium]|nr:polysaccharide deacetylase family protein [Ignavibacteriales bacterium]